MGRIRKPKFSLLSRIKLIPALSAVVLLLIFLAVTHQHMATTAHAGLLHNSNEFPGTTKWGGSWGVAGGQYGAITCATCHYPKTPNIKKVAGVVTAPSGAFPGSAVSFNNLTSMGRDSDNHLTSVRVCEVCHSKNKYHNYNTANNTGGTIHNNDADCTGCHPHNVGFKASESGGGAACNSCHNDLTALGGVNGYHHYINNYNATPGAVAQPAVMGGATDTNRNCLMCHVDHNFFRPDLNTTNGGRGKNLRADISTTPVVATPSTYTNTDFVNSGNGGICMSCHRTSQTNLGYTQPDGQVRKIAIPYANTTTASQLSAYSNSAHGGTYTYFSYSSAAQYTGLLYTVSSTFSGTLTNNYVANCTKCHNDTMAPNKSGYNGQGASQYKFGNHTTTRKRMLTSFGNISTLTKGANFCFKCHGNQPVRSTTAPSNVYLTASQTQYDWYSSAKMGPRTKNIYGDFNDPILTHKHQVQTPAYLERHKPSETRADISNNRHVTCDDCHNHHASKPGLHIKGGPRNLSPALTGALGVQAPISTAWLPAWSAPTFQDTLVPAKEEWQICFKCHSSYNQGLTTVWDSTWTDISVEFNPRNPGGHAVIGNSRVPATQPVNFIANSGLTKNSILTCTDCHVSSYDTSKSSIYPSGGHASKNPFMLKGNYDPSLDSRVTTGGPAEMCSKCHDPYAYGIFDQTTPTPTPQPPSGFSTGTGNNKHLDHSHGQGLVIYKCAQCHSARIHGWKRPGMIVLNGDPAPYLQTGIDHVSLWGQHTNTYQMGNCSDSAANPIAASSQCTPHKSPATGGTNTFVP